MGAYHIPERVIKKAEHINKIEGSVVFPIPQLNRVDILNLEREGITIFLEDEFTTGEVVGNAWRYRVKYLKDASNKPGDLFQESMSGTATRTWKYKLIGANPTLSGLIYQYNILGKASRYTVQPGDTEVDILNGLATEIQNADYDSFSASAGVTDNRLVVTASIFGRPTWDVVYQDNVIFKTGYYAYINIFDIVKKVLLTEQSSQVEFPVVDALQPSYDYNTLTEFTGQINDYLQPQGYTHGFWPEQNVGNTTITNAPLSPSTTSRAVHDQPNSRIIYHPSSPQKANERSLILYR